MGRLKEYRGCPANALCRLPNARFRQPGGRFLLGDARFRWRNDTGRFAAVLHLENFNPPELARVSRAFPATAFLSGEARHQPEARR